MMIVRLVRTRRHSDCAIKVDTAYFGKCFCFAIIEKFYGNKSDLYKTKLIVTK